MGKVQERDLCRKQGLRFYHVQSFQPWPTQAKWLTGHKGGAASGCLEEFQPQCHDLVSKQLKLKVFANKRFALLQPQKRMFSLKLP